MAARFLDESAARTVLEVADDWNASIERWTYAAGTPLARRLGLTGTYLRVTSAAVLAGAPLDTPAAVRNRAAPGDRVPATAVISPDVLALVRFGLRPTHDPRIVDRPPAVLERWHEQPPAVARRTWRPGAPSPSIPRWAALRIELLEPAIVHLSMDGWATVHDVVARDTGIGLWTVDLPAAQIADSESVVFTLRWAQAARWEGRDFGVQVEPSGTPTK